MDIISIFHGAQEAAGEFINDPFIKIKAIDADIAFCKLQIVAISEKIKELEDQRKQVCESIKK